MCVRPSRPQRGTGDEIFFDGWVVRRVRGMGLHGLDLSIHDSSNTRSFQSGNKVVSNHICDNWKYQKSSGVVRYFQKCSDRNSYKNSILVQNNGNISLIRQIVDGRYTALSLAKLT